MGKKYCLAFGATKMSKIGRFCVKLGHFSKFRRLRRLKLDHLLILITSIKSVIPCLIPDSNNRYSFLVCSYTHTILVYISISYKSFKNILCTSVSIRIRTIEDQYKKYLGDMISLLYNSAINSLIHYFRHDIFINRSGLWKSQRSH